jgi:hypothetical protein
MGLRHAPRDLVRLVRRLDWRHLPRDLSRHLRKRTGTSHALSNHALDFARLRRTPIKRGMPHTLPGKLVVSLTSYPPRYQTLDLTLRTLLSQEMAPDEIVLWIAHEDRASLPRRVEALQDYGLIVRTCEDLKSFKKLIPSISTYPDAYIVTADDDRRYAPNWIRRFAEEYTSPNEILCQEAYRIILDLNGRLLPYNEWPSLGSARGPTDLGGPGIFPVGSEGILYPPGAFKQEVLNVAEALRLCPHGDDIWNYWMTQPGIVRRRIHPAGKICDEWPGTSHVGLWLTQNIRGGNDRQIAAMIEAYGLPPELSRLSAGAGLQLLNETIQRYRYNASDAGLEAWPSEASYLAILKQMAINSPNARHLEVGCGMGRIVDIVKDTVGSLVGLEPDPERYLACYNEHHDGDRTRILNETLREYVEGHPGERFEIVTVSHVLQHVSRATCNQILCDVRHLLTPEGKAIIATTHGPMERFRYAQDNSSMTTGEFDIYAMDFANQRYGIPVRQFSKASFCQAVADAGLAIEEWDHFSFVRPEKTEWFADQLQVPQEFLREMGISQYVIVKRGNLSVPTPGG